jgi:hypothetical protein
MLAVHDERIDQCNKDDSDICKKVEDIESKIDNLYKFRWQAGGVLAVIVVLVGIVNAFVPKLLTAPSTPATIERAK